MSGPLKILVPVKRVIDYVIKPRVNSTRTAVETANVKHSMNPFDELSLEAAVRLREASTPNHPRKSPTPSPLVADILALSAGPAKCVDVLRTAMAMGADRAIHVEVGGDPKAGGGEGGAEGENGELEPLGVAKLLKRVVETEGSNMVILGKQSIDDDSNQTGQMLAGLLGWGQATQASDIRFEEDGQEGWKVRVTKEVDGGVETVRGPLPMVVTTDLRLNEPRYASLPNIMKAKKKRLERKTLGDYGVDGGRRLRVLRVEEPPPRKGGGKVEDVDGMISRLKELGAI
ncbi:MAG: hypothetical protein LQ338_002499 [Usnochroma carphineum]|nr:MAG: hypothetical protein LQ338_002499 [Usnochroma carphineum]